MFEAKFNLDPFTHAVLPGGQSLWTLPHLPFLTTCSDDSKPYIILKALDESYKNNYSV